MNLEEYQLVSPRELWPDEVKDFQRWFLEGEGRSKLEHCLNLKFASIRPGKISRDGIPDIEAIIARKGNARICPTEVQLGAADRPHHSSILTYRNRYRKRDLGHPIWIAADFGERYLVDILKMNEKMGFGRDIILVRVELWKHKQTGEYFPNLVRILGLPLPKKVLEKRSESADKVDIKIREQEFLSLLQQESKIILPNHFRDRPISHGIIKHRRAPGIVYMYDATLTHVRIGWGFVSKSGNSVEERQKTSAKKNKACLDYFMQFKNEIELAFGRPLHAEYGKLEHTLTWAVKGAGYGIPVKHWDVGIAGLPRIMKDFIEVNESYVDGLLKLSENQPKRRFGMPKKLKNPRSQLPLMRI